jgi:hypothetical protein
LSTAVANDAEASAASTAYVNAASTAALTDAGALSTAYVNAASTAALTDADALSASYSTAVVNDALLVTTSVAFDAAMDSVAISPNATVANPYEISQLTAAGSVAFTGDAGLSTSDLYELIASEASTAAAEDDLDGALEYVAGLSQDFVVFEYGSDAYIFNDIEGNDQADETDLLVKIDDYTSFSDLTDILGTEDT